jgi:fatty-acyl-CoA synthase
LTLYGVHQNVFAPHILLKSVRDGRQREMLWSADGASWTGGDIEREVSRIVQVLRAFKITRGSRVALLSLNRPEVLFLEFALAALGAVFVPLHPRGSVEDFSYVVTDAEVEILIFDPAAYSDVAEVLSARFPEKLTLISIGPSKIACDLVDLANSCKAEPLAIAPVAGDDVSRLAYSGGTTGRPKAIQLTYRMIASTIMIMTGEWEWPDNPRQLICAPLSHSGGLCFLPTILRGGAVHLLPAFDALSVMAAIERHGINCILLVPTMIYAMLDHPQSEDFDLASLETIFYGAAPMSVARLKQGIARFGPVFFQFYGQSEAPMTVCVLRRQDHDLSRDDRLASCGRPVPWLHVALLDADGREVGEGEPAEICVRGPIVMPGYLNQPEQTAEAFKHGWLHTGDIAVRDAQGFLRIVDRAKDMIITGGFNVFPREVEDALESHPSVLAASVYGLADAHWGEVVSASVVLRNGEAATSDELIAHVRKLKGAVQAPKRLSFMDQLPTTALGKPDKKALRLMASGQATTGGVR